MTYIDKSLYQNVLNALNEAGIKTTEKSVQDIPTRVQYKIESELSADDFYRAIHAVTHQLSGSFKVIKFAFDTNVLHLDHSNNVWTNLEFNNPRSELDARQFEPLD